MHHDRDRSEVTEMPTIEMESRAVCTDILRVPRELSSLAVAV
jgi:hypothetical protein